MELRFILTSNCNFNCYFCLNEYYGSKSSDYSLHAIDYKKIAESAAKEGVSKITLTGGEPTLRKDLADITDVIRPIVNHITMVTNGVLLSKRIEAISKIDELHVSFHTFNNEEWQRITGSKGKYREEVQRQITIIRNEFPLLKIKLNVVSEHGNNEQVEQYIAFAKKNNLQINVFQEGYFKMYELLNISLGDAPKPSSWWDLSMYSPVMLYKSTQKETYLVDDVTIHLCYTSTDEMRWNSIWIGPNGEAYASIVQETPVIDLYNLCKNDNLSLINDSIISLIKEAILSNQIKDDEHNEYLKMQLSMLINERNSILPTTNKIPITNLLI